MRVSLHLSTTQRAIGGALYYYGEISRLVSRADDPDLEVLPHDVYALCAADETEQRRFVASLGAGDVLLSAIGPYAYLYFYLRERYQGSFRIVRDIRTTSWAGFLLQEQLVAPLLRDSDLLLCPSEFSRQYFITLFPGLNRDQVRVCYPLADSFPERVNRTASRSLRIGYIGRISENKNLAQVLSIYRSARKQHHKKAELHLAGQVSFDSRHLSQKRMLGQYLRTHGVSEAEVRYRGYLYYADIWRFYSEVDALLFPALANVESLGRVLVEAARAGVPVIASNYAASPELLPADNLVRTRYELEQEFDTLGTFSYGSVDEADALEKLFHLRPGEDCSRRGCFQSARFFHYLKGDSSADRPQALGEVVSAFLRSLTFSGLPQLSRDESMERIRPLYAFFAYYLSNRLPHRLRLLTDAVGVLRHDPGAAQLYLDRVLRPVNRPVLKHATQFCRQAGFRPTVRLRPNAQDWALLQAHPATDSPTRST